MTPIEETPVPATTEGGGAPPIGGTGEGIMATSNGLGSPGANGSDVWPGLVKDPDNLSYVKTKNWKSPEEAIKSYRELETQFSKSEKAPPPPESPEAYQFKLAETVPETFPYEEATANEFREVAHKARMPVEMAQGLHDWYIDKQAKAYQEGLKLTAGKVTSAHEKIVKAFGDPSGDQYKRGVELADRAVRELGDPSDRNSLRKELVEIGAILPDGKIMAPNLILALSKIGEELYAEDRVFSGISSSENPFKASSENLTAQGRLLTENPEQARQLILAANLKPTDYGLK